MQVLPTGVIRNGQMSTVVTIIIVRIVQYLAVMNMSTVKEKAKGKGKEENIRNEIGDLMTSRLLSDCYCNV